MAAELQEDPSELALRRYYPAILTVVGLLLFFPGLGSFGFWDPYEIRVADAARLLAGGAWNWGPQLGHPPATVWLVAVGFKLFGVGELGGRLPVAFCSLLTLLSVYYAGAPLVGRRAALIGSFALATTPTFLLGARQLTTFGPSMLAATLAIGGLAHATWPEAGTSLARRVVDLLLAAVGLTIGFFSSGLLVGVLAPVGAVTLAVIAAGGSPVAGGIGLFATVGLGLQVGWAFTHPGAYSAVLGGTPHAFLHTTTISTHLVRLGFGMFPWIAMVPVAALRAFDEGPQRARFGGLLLLSWVVVIYVAATFALAGVQDLHVPVGPALMLLAGWYLDGALRDGKQVPFAALAVALGALILGRDFFNFPEQFIGVHVLEAVRWPGPLTQLPYVVMAYGAFWAGLIGIGLGVPLVPAWSPVGSRRRSRGVMLLAAGGASLAMALVSAHVIVPQVSKHLSARDLYGKARLLDPNAPLGQYRFNATGSSYYGGGKNPEPLATLQDLFTFLARPERVFVMAGSDELPNIDQESRQKKTPYHVVDDSNSRYLVISNQLGPKEQDLNPLKRFISDQPPKVMIPVEADFEGKVKLLGYDLPAELARGQEFKIRLYFQVLQPLGGNYKVFIHFDGSGSRFNGDHTPLEGRFPTPNWVPGYYITDEHLMTPDRAMQPAGAYRIFMGLFAGEGRLKVTSGPQDGENRVKLGGVNIK